MNMCWRGRRRSLRKPFLEETRSDPLPPLLLPADRRADLVWGASVGYAELCIDGFETAEIPGAAAVKD